LTLVEEIELLKPDLLLAEIRDYLGRYMFGGEDVFRKVSTLSGGERGRLALAKLGLTDANLLLLDEPTNHLDIPSQEILQEVLADYPGTILLVSHDRYLIDAIGTQIWEIEPGEQSMVIFEGTYSAYKAQREAERLAEEERSRQVQVSMKPSPRASSASEDRRRRKRLEEVEGQIADLESRLAELSEKLENPPLEPDEVRRLGEAFVTHQNHLENLIEEWEVLQR